MKPHLIALARRPNVDGSKLVSEFHLSLLASKYNITYVTELPTKDSKYSNYLLYKDLPALDDFMSTFPKDTVVLVTSMWDPIHYEHIKLAKKHGFQVWLECHADESYNDLVLGNANFTLGKYLYPATVDKLYTYTSKQYYYYKFILGCPNVFKLDQVIDIDDLDQFVPDEKFIKDQNLGNYIISIGSFDNNKNIDLGIELFLRYGAEKFDNLVVVTQSSVSEIMVSHDYTSHPNIRFYEKADKATIYNLLMHSAGFIHLGLIETGPLVVLEALVSGTHVLQFEYPMSDVNYGQLIDVNDIIGSYQTFLQYCLDSPHLPKVNQEWKRILQKKYYEHKEDYMLDDGSKSSNALLNSMYTIKNYRESLLKTYDNYVKVTKFRKDVLGC